MSHLAAALVAALALAPAVDAPGAPQGGGDLARLQGAWTGKGGPADGLQDVEVEFRGSTIRITLTRPDGRTSTGRGSFKLDESAKPKALDLVDFRAPETQPPRPAPPFIYALDGDALRLCGAGDADQPRPTEFKSSGSGRMRTVLLDLTRKPSAK